MNIIQSELLEFGETDPDGRHRGGVDVEGLLTVAGELIRINLL